MLKNEIYIEVLEWALPYIRNVQSQNSFRKANDKSCYYEAELVHNLPRKLLTPNFTDSDIHFLNYQAKFYYDNCNAEISINYPKQVFYIKELFKIVPIELQDKLIWKGPE